MCRLSKRCVSASTVHDNFAWRAADVIAVFPAVHIPANTIFGPAIFGRHASVSVRSATLPGHSRDLPGWPLPALPLGIRGSLTSPGRGGAAEERPASPAALFPELYDRGIQLASAAG